MLLKMIFCQVEKEKKGLFSEAQERWRGLQNLEGFHGQFGGWNEEEACVFSAWKDMNTYQQFMNKMHDPIFHNSNQKDTYVSCKTELYQTLFDIIENPFTNAIPQSSFIRTAICDVKIGHEKPFLHVQETIWNKGMEKSQGMLGGVVGKSLTNSNRYVVLSFWENKMLHQRYVKEIFPRLYELANISEDVENINGKQVACLKEWSVY
ncbi:YdbC family protein [Bacillus sp. C1]